MFLVRNQNGDRCALKRLSVNEEIDLIVCRQEIDIMVRSTNFHISIRGVTFLQNHPPFYQFRGVPFLTMSLSKIS